MFPQEFLWSSVCKILIIILVFMFAQVFLKKEFSEENILFWQACESFSQIPEHDKKQVISYSTCIVSWYIQRLCNYPVEYNIKPFGTKFSFSVLFLSELALFLWVYVLSWIKVFLHYSQSFVTLWKCLIGITDCCLKFFSAMRYRVWYQNSKNRNSGIEIRCLI